MTAVGGVQLGHEPSLPAVLIVERDVDDAVIVGPALDVRRHQRADPLDAELADEKTNFEQHVLSRAADRDRRALADRGELGSQMPEVVAGEKVNGLWRSAALMPQLTRGDRTAEVWDPKTRCEWPIMDLLGKWVFVLAVHEWCIAALRI